MKILFGIQGTGNGHLTRSMEMIPHLRKLADVDVLISGEQYDLKPSIEPDYRFKGLYFVFGKKGGIDFIETFKKINSFRLLREIREFPVEKYDLVVSDFEPVSSWSAFLHDVPCIGLSNQAATLHPDAPQPKAFDPLGKLILEYYAPTTMGYGFHFKALSEKIFTPLIRNKVRNLSPEYGKHYTVYLPAYEDERIIKSLKKFNNQHWEVFTKHNKKSYREKNIYFRPIQDQAFLESMAASKGVLCNAGFGTASEALFLGKKLMVIPMKNQYEQQCNAAMLKSMGVSVVKSLKKKHHDKLRHWIHEGESISVNYPDITASVAELVVNSIPQKNLRRASA